MITEELKTLLDECTDGEWTLIPNNDDHCYQIDSPCTVVGETYYQVYCDKEALANARLMALAPELAKEVIELTRLLENCVQELEDTHKDKRKLYSELLLMNLELAKTKLLNKRLEAKED